MMMMVSLRLSNRRYLVSLISFSNLIIMSRESEAKGVHMYLDERECSLLKQDYEGLQSRITVP